jgi:hypothetical protein
MKFTITKLDRRYAESSYFKYRIEMQFPYWSYENHADRVRQTQDILEWCWEVFGPGCERDSYKHLAFEENPNTLIAQYTKNAPQWAWYYDPKDRTPYIYIVDDTVLSHIQLKWTA